MRRAAFVVGLLLGFVAARPAAAADPQGRFATKGVGQARCADLNAAATAKSPRLASYLSWIAGYLSAANRYETNTYDLIAWQGELYLLSQIQSYCAKNPGTDLLTMSRAMVRSLGPGRIASASPLVSIDAGGRRFTLYGEIVRRAKLKLAAARLYSGPIDMTADAGFVAALAAFQRTERLPPSGAPDQETLYRLLMR